MKILVIDNYDSFVYNLIYLIKEIGEHQIDVKRNNQLELSAIQQYDKILLSPGPGIPEEAGQLMEVIDRYASTKDILGICLGHQALGQYFGMKLTQLQAPLHGISSPINITVQDKLFEGIPNTFSIAHYHSWVVDTPTADIEVIAYDGYGNITAFRHKKYTIRGLQFHPESILTTAGKQIINNWLKK